MRPRDLIRRRPGLAAALATAMLGLAIFGLVWFQPQKVVIDERVDEPLPMASAPDGSPARGKQPPRAAARADTLASGSFRSFEHETTGQARVLRLSDGSRFLRLDRLSTSNGPDLRVYLSATPAADPSGSFDRDFVELGRLKGNVGSQSYRIPPEVRLDRFRSAVVWCKRFSVVFGAAPLR